MEISNEPQKMTRRDFLGKLPALLYGVTRRPEANKPNNDILSIETPEARYFPIYELHPQPASREQLELLPAQDIFLYEYPSDSRYFIDPLTSPQMILDTKLRNSSAFSGSKRTYVIPRDHLEWLRENNTKICFEGYSLPQKYSSNAVLVMTAETIIAGSGAFQLMLHAKTKENNEKEMDRRQFVKLAAGLAAAWGLSSIAGMLAPLNFFKTEVKQNALERIVIKAVGLLSQAHPENSIVFFRNIMIARKLQFLGEVASKERGQKAQIVYNVGKAHAGIEDFLQIGKDWTLAFLNIMPNSFLKAVIDENGGLENFCSNALFDPNAQNPTKTILVDQELKAFLNK